MTPSPRVSRDPAIFDSSGTDSLEDLLGQLFFKGGLLLLIENPYCHVLGFSEGKHGHKQADELVGEDVIHKAFRPFG